MIKYSFLASLCVWLVMPSVQASTYISGRELNEAITAYLLEQGFAAKPSLNAHRLFKACQENLNFAPLFGNFHSLRVTCPDETGWRLVVRTHLLSPQTPPPKGSAPQKDVSKVAYIVVTKSLKRGDVITAQDIDHIYGPPKAYRDFFISRRDVIGRKVKQSINIGEMVRARALEPDWMIQKGQPVMLESRIGPIHVLSHATALENAQWGELARVLNIRSGKEIVAKVLSEKKVSVWANMD